MNNCHAPTFILALPDSCAVGEHVFVDLVLTWLMKVSCGYFADQALGLRVLAWVIE